MDQSVAYEALSYVWGDTKTYNSIMINEKPFLIRESLYYALVALRSVSERKVLWVDAICINQGSVAERNLQVRQMNRIYADAKVVAAWLGEPTLASDRGINFLRGFKNISPDGWGLRDTERKSIEGYRRLYSPIIASLGDGISESGLHEALQLLQRPWWTRMWTLQESVLCRNVLCWCGQDSLPVSCFWEFTWFIFLSTNYGAWTGPTIDASLPFRTTMWIGRLGWMIAREGKISLLVAVNVSWNRAATDPKDKIIGLLGLIDQSSGLVAEYGWPVDKVYRKAFAAVLREAKDINPLGLIKELPENRNPRLPSWVPDFEIHSGHGGDDFDSLSKPIWARTRRCYSASLAAVKNHLQFETKADDSILVVEGMEFDRVKIIGGKAPGWDLGNPTQAVNGPWREAMRKCLSQWRTMIASEEGDYLTGESPVNAFWRTVLVDLKQGSAVGYDRLEPHDLKSLLGLETDQGIDDLFYVHGAMDGEIARAAAFENLPCQKFEIE
ncbi:heterokaryon incompatibility protein 6, OR allele [Colletotrichum spaethianum]|uniref:Heterokaryon incompatibility protein 6, OR allele n=1 Tax=Colletotrichum spaethianum TaxID=700344 RepID=A0AA37L4A0_9PEZI|nr:heterokaryon incompatibility protein 6, OR allele [Colletotrichum spaethianum]GKT41597.1 heterokaryon incompatibility protein 6, OR allele [Colletotrichum spaethianum]